jgi:predicted nucleic-acid-binding Zn-ribbon protein
MSEPSPCSHCGGNEHFTARVNAGGGVSANLLPGAGFLESPNYRIVVCGACGLTRWFVPGEFLSMVRSTYDRVG